MSDVEITLFFNEHRLNRLNAILSERESNTEQVLLDALNHIYEQTVPENERRDIENLIQRETQEEAERREAARRFAVIHLGDGDESFHFTTDNCTDFFDISKVYHNDIRDKVGRYTLDSLADYFGEYQPINELTFSVLCDAMPNDPRITALVDFDFENNKVCVCDSSDNAWYTYSLDDISRAVNKANRKSGLLNEDRREIFNTDLEGKEMLSNEQESQTMQVKPL